MHICRTAPHTIHSDIEGKGKFFTVNLHQVLTDQIKHTLENGMHVGTTIHLSLACDGVKLFKSANASFWPFLGMLCDNDPFVIGLFLGTGKPGKNYFKFVVREIKKAIKHPIEVFGLRYKVVIHNICCDAPARAHLMNTITHAGANSCSRCTSVSKSVNSRMLFDGTYGMPRNSHTFNSLGYSISTNRFTPYQKGPSEFSGLVDCVEQFNLDIMHLIFEGN